MYVCIHVTEKSSKSSTHYLNNTTEFDISNAGRNVKLKGEKRTGNISVKFCI